MRRSILLSVSMLFLTSALFVGCEPADSSMDKDGKDKGVNVDVGKDGVDVNVGDGVGVEVGDGKVDVDVGSDDQD